MDTEIPEEFWQGIEQFNQGDFYACHDTLEAIWIEAPVVDKRFYQGILQIAVGLYHLGNHNWRGAVILMGEGLNRLGDYQPEYGGIEVGQFIEDASELLSEIQTAGQERIDQIVLTDHPPLESTDKIFLRPPIIQKITAKG
jgi:predicted metal-dependent hydrolase